MKTKKNIKNLGLKMTSKEGKLWSDFLEVQKANLKNAEEQVIIFTKIVGFCEDQVKLEKEKFDSK